LQAGLNSLHTAQQQQGKQGAEARHNTLEHICGGKVTRRHICHI
jgi:hypothetical protein